MNKPAYIMHKYLVFRNNNKLQMTVVPLFREKTKQIELRWLLLNILDEMITSTHLAGCHKLILDCHYASKASWAQNPKDEK